jgi:hypothetical protein
MEKFIVHFIEDDDNMIMALQINTYIIHLARQNKWGGSVSGRMVINRGRLEGDFRLFNDYFSKNPTYPDFMFRQRFRMRISLFRQIVQDLQDHDEYFIQKRDAAGKLGFSSIQKVTAAMRMIAYGCSADSIDEYTRMGMFIHIFMLLMNTHEWVCLFIFLCIPSHVVDFEGVSFEAESTSLKCLKQFCQAIVSVYSSTY